MPDLCCKKCGSTQYVKNGFVKDKTRNTQKQRYQCKDCGCQFTDTPPRGVNPVLRALCLFLYAHCGVSQNKLAQLAQVSPPAVLKWIKAAGRALQPIETTAESDIVCLDEMWHFVNGKKTKFGSGAPWTVCHVQFADGSLVLGQQRHAPA